MKHMTAIDTVEVLTIIDLLNMIEDQQDIIKFADEDDTASSCTLAVVERVKNHLTRKLNAPRPPKPQVAKRR